MFKAVYPFKSHDSGTLEAKQDELFCAIASDKSGLWLQAANAAGDVGYLPKNYLCLCDSVESSFVMQFLDTGIARANQSMAYKYGDVQLEKLRVLTTHRNYLDKYYNDFLIRLQLETNGDSVVHSSVADKASSQIVESSPATPNLSHNAALITSRTKQHSSHAEQNLSHKEQIISQPEPIGNPTKVASSQTSQTGAYEGKLPVDHPQANNNLEQPSISLSNTSKTSTEYAENCKHSSHKDLSGEDQSTQINQTPDRNFEKTLEKATGDGIYASRAFHISSDVLARQLIEVLRTSSNLSYDMCKVGVAAVLETLISQEVPYIQLEDIRKAVSEGPSSDHSDAELSNDQLEMTAIFDMIAECKDDSQQRSWPLHEDEFYISGKLSKLLEILTMGNRDVLLKGILDNLDQVQGLVVYYQLETRASLRTIMLQIFGALCTMSSLLITNLLCSVLTLELVRDLMSTAGLLQQIDDQRLMYSAVVLSMLFSTGEPIPVQHNTLLSSSFIDFLLDKVETSADSRMTDVCFELLLSFNQHFSDPDSNIVLQQLSSRHDSAVLTQKFVKLFNSGDPVRIIPNEEQIHSVLKFALDLYSQSTTSQLIYTNDAKVLIEIVIRQLTNLSDEDVMRTDYLSLMHLIISNSNYHEHSHRKDDLISALNQIEFNEEATTSQSEMDIRIVQEIRKAL
ncbi:NCK-interacting protein with SH3 domain-like isoform X2 [Watersipora subatra]|uniref:NCK-interacting protein with SH3 domain-like isoform X2 n=1 Tax=Watersipora subatra TaxID=2589382 RepID=UPI00355B7AD8